MDNKKEGYTQASNAGAFKQTIMPTNIKKQKDDDEVEVFVELQPVHESKENKEDEDDDEVDDWHYMKCIYCENKFFRWQPLQFSLITSSPFIRCPHCKNKIWLNFNM